MPVLAPEREEVRVAPAVETAAPRARRPRAPRPSRSILRTVAVVVLSVLALVGLSHLGDLIPSLHNPFREHTVDRTGPVVLKAVNDLHTYQAASGSFQVFVDLEKDTKYVPAIIKGERTLFLATGTVDAGVDFSQLGPTSVSVSGDRRSVTVTVPHAVLSGARIDPAHSYVVDRSRGLLDRIGSVFSDSPTSERALYQAAQAKIADAAAADSGLRDRADANTRELLTSLLTSLGFTHVTVAFS